MSIETGIKSIQLRDKNGAEERYPVRRIGICIPNPD